MRSKSYMYFHMIDQLHCMVTDKGEWAVDFIGRVEETNADWAEVRSFGRLYMFDQVPKLLRHYVITSYQHTWVCCWC
jgi:hypothetical protein